MAVLLILTACNALCLVCNIGVLTAVIKLYTDFVKTAVFTKKGGGI